MAELDGKIALVTGAGRLRGIGRAAAVALARLGADVAISGTGRDPATFPDDERALGWRDVESVAEQIRDCGRRALPLVFDVADLDQVNEAVDRIVGELGRIDILINNAAIARGADRTTVETLDPDLFQRVVDVKVRGTFLCTQAVIRHIYRQDEGGKIVNIASIAGKRGSANTLAYNAANFAMIGMTQSMAREFGPAGRQRELRMPRCGGHVADGRREARRPSRTQAPRRSRQPLGQRRRGRRVRRLPLHRSGVVDPRPIHQPGRRRGDGALDT